MKKLLLIASSVLLFSCTTGEELETSANTESNSKQITLQKAKSGASLLVGENITLKCNGSSNFQNPINVNPNYPYISSYEVLYRDLAPLYGRNQLRLSEFVAKHIWGYGGPFTSLTEIYIGYNAMNDFNNSSVNYSYIQDYTIGQDGDNAQIYGDMFGSNSVPMTNDAANTVYHGFKAKIDQLTSQGKQITAVHLYTDGLLCIPSVRFIKMTVKVL